MSNRHEWILAQANDWLKFAEAKNAALVVFNAAVLVAVVQLVFEHPPTHSALKLYLASMSAFIGGGMLVALFSFLPKTSIPLLSAGERPNPRDNLIFFGAAKKYSTQDYLREVNARYGMEQHTNARWEQDIAEQVVTNARIAVWKYTCFKIALWATICGLLTPIAGPLVFGLLYAWSKTHRI